MEQDYFLGKSQFRLIFLGLPQGQVDSLG